MTLAIGDVLTREDGRRYKLVGVDNDGSWIGEPLDSFGPPESLDARLLASGFGVDGDQAKPEAADEAAGWHALAAQNRMASNIAAADAGDLVPGMDANTSALGDAHDTGAIRPPDLDGDTVAARRYVSALRQVARKIRREREPTPEETFAKVDQVAADNAKKVAANSKRDTTGRVSKTRGKG